MKVISVDMAKDIVEHHQTQLRALELYAMKENSIEVLELIQLFKTFSENQLQRLNSYGVDISDTQKATA